MSFFMHIIICALCVFSFESDIALISGNSSVRTAQFTLAPFINDDVPMGKDVVIESVTEEVYRLARRAGQIMKDSRARAFSGTGGRMVQNIKADKSVVTVADLEIQNLLDEALVKLIPGSVIIGEESYNGGEILDKAGSADYLWVVDPIDGTQAFINADETEFGVAIVLLYKGQPVLSVFFAPEWDVDGSGSSFFAADEVSGKSTLNGRELIPADGQMEGRFIDIVVVENERPFPDSLPVRSNVRYYVIPCPFSSMVKFCSVAASGTFKDLPVMFCTNLYPKIWDSFPAALILKNAGVRMVYEDGTDVFPFLLKDLLPNLVDDAPCTKRILAFPESMADEAMTFSFETTLLYAA